MKREFLPVPESDNHDREKLKEELAALQRLFDSSLDVICSIDKDGRFVNVSAGSKNVWGYAAQYLQGKPYLDFVIPDDHLKTIAAAATIMSGIDLTSFENRYIKGDGSIVPILWSARWDKAEQLMYCIAKDATQIRRVEDDRGFLARRLKRAYKLADLAWWEYDVATQTYTSSDEIFTMYGLPIPENNQTTFEEFLSFVHPDDKEKLQLDISAICQDNYFNYEHRVVKPTGEIIHVIHFSEVIRNENGLPIAIHGTAKDITQRKLHELRLEESERKLQRYSQQLYHILESIGDGFFTVDHESRITYWNRKAEELLHKKREEVIGCGLWQVYPEVIPLKFYSSYRRAVEENTTVKFEEYFPPLSIWIEAVVYPSNEGVSVYFKDISEEKQQQQAVQLAKERFELAAKATSDVLWDWDIVSNNCYFNESFTALFGHQNVADTVYKNWLENIHEADRQEVIESVTVALNDPDVKQYQAEYRFYRRDGSLAHVLDRGFIIRDSDRKAIRMVGSMQDITKMKETEAKMRKLSLVAEKTVNVVVITDANDKITWVNKAFTDLTEYSFEEVIGKRPADLLQGPKTNDETKKYLHECVANRRPFHCEILNYTKSGREYWMEIQGQPLFDRNGKLEQFFAIQTDITERKEAEEMMRLSEEKYRLLFHSSPRPMWTFDAETFHVVDVNHAATDLYGYTKEEFLQLTIHDMKCAEDHKELASVVASLRSKKERHFQSVVRHKKKSGELFYIEITSFAIQLTTGTHIMVFGTDMTEKMQLQQKLIAEKVSAQKQIARAIIHAQETERSEIGKELHDNVCQLLTTSKLYIENIRYMPDQQEEFTRKGIDLLMRSINEIRYLSRQLVSPAVGNMDFETSVNDLITHYLSMNLFDIRFDYEATIELVDKDLKTSIIRILQEQLNNTVKYAKASAVKIRISNTEESLKLHYEDNGVGFDPQHAKKGIGLANIKNRASAYRGTVELESGVGKGCTMEITFPLKEQTIPLEDEALGGDKSLSPNVLINTEAA